MGEKGYAETRRGPSHQVASQVTCQSCDSVTWSLLVSSLCLAGPCLVAAALPGWWLAGAGPGWLGRALAGGWLPSPAVAQLGAWRAWAGGLQHTQHTLTKLTPPLTLMR